MQTIKVIFSTICIFAFCSLFISPLFSQSLEDHISNHLAQEDYDRALRRVEITTSHTAVHSGVQHIYFQQTYDGITIHKAIGNVAIQGSTSYFKTKRLVRQRSLFRKNKTNYDAFNCLKLSLKHLNLPLPDRRIKKSQIGEYEIVFKNLSAAEDEVVARKVWAKGNNKKYSFAWLFEFKVQDRPDYWEIVVSTVDGAVLDQANYTAYCSFDRPVSRDSELVHDDFDFQDPDLYEMGLMVDSSAYRVFAPPLESPLVGQRSLETDPSDPEASPFGWHDTNGLEGADFNTLRGNNISAYLDSAAINRPSGAPVEPPSSLIFDFPFERDSSVFFNLEADITNLFFWNNYVHDWSYKFGFDESAGNFQFNNYGNGGEEGDHVVGETLDGSGVNDASFSTPRDGTNPRMQLHKWIQGGDFQIISPPQITGIYNTGSSLFGPTNLENGINGEIVYIEDTVNDNRDACDSIVNAVAINGNIALIDRGTCDFSFKVHTAQEAGAIACIICNNNDNETLINMGAGANASLVNIPSVFISKEDCALFKAHLEGGVQGNFEGAKEVSAAFDNAVIAHEYGHGISNRLTGGPNSSSCLNNEEGMGEGISDFFALVLTSLPGANKNKPRPIGNYLLGEASDGRGVRRYPYSFDFSINPQTMSHMRYNVRVHDIGESWAAVLWDMFWLFVEQDGFDHTWEDPESGNYKAVQLVFDGLKLQECDPGFLEARDAILDADEMNYQGENACLIWSAFARRGMGIDAIQGSTNDPFDNADGFEKPLMCNEQVSIRKNITPTFDPGDTITVELNISNYKEDLENLVVTDQIPTGTSILNVSNQDIASTNDSQVSWAIGSLEFGNEISLTYELTTSQLTNAAFEIFDDLEGVIQFESSVTNTETDGWAISNLESSSGTLALHVEVDTFGGESYATRIENIEVSSNSNLLRFDHTYELDLGFDGGVVEISTDRGRNWNPVDLSAFILNGPPDVISNCFNRCPQPDYFYRNLLPAYTGTRDWHTSIIDLSLFMGQEIQVRFRYVSLLFNDDISAAGWFIDNFELYERKEVSSEACILQGSTALDCTKDFALINSDVSSVPVTEIVEDKFQLKLTPNPASSVINISIFSQERYPGSFRITSIDGKVIDSFQSDVFPGQNFISKDVSAFIPGIYILEHSNGQERHAVTFVIQ